MRRAVGEYSQLYDVGPSSAPDPAEIVPGGFDWSQSSHAAGVEGNEVSPSDARGTSREGSVTLPDQTGGIRSSIRSPRRRSQRWWLDRVRAETKRGNVGWTPRVLRRLWWALGYARSNSLISGRG